MFEYLPANFDILFSYFSINNMETSTDVESVYVALAFAHKQQQRTVAACVLRKRSRSSMEDHLTDEFQVFEFVDNEQVRSTYIYMYIRSLLLTWSGCCCAVQQFGQLVRADWSLSSVCRNRRIEWYRFKYVEGRGMDCEKHICAVCETHSRSSCMLTDAKKVRNVLGRREVEVHETPKLSFKTAELNGNVQSLVGSNNSNLLSIEVRLWSFV